MFTSHGNTVLSDHSATPKKLQNYTYYYVLRMIGVMILTWSRAGPRTGTRKPWYRNSRRAFWTFGCDICTTTLQNSRELMNVVSSLISATSSGVNRCQSSASIDSLRGRREYSPLKPVASTWENNSSCNTVMLVANEIYKIRVAKNSLGQRLGSISAWEFPHSWKNFFIL